MMMIQCLGCHFRGAILGCLASMFVMLKVANMPIVVVKDNLMASLPVNLMVDA